MRYRYRLCRGLRTNVLQVLGQSQSAPEGGTVVGPRAEPEARIPLAGA